MRVVNSLAGAQRNMVRRGDELSGLFVARLLICLEISLFHRASLSRVS